MQVFKAEAEILQKTKEAELNAEMMDIQRKIVKAEAKAKVYDEQERSMVYEGTENITEEIPSESKDNKTSLHETVSKMLRVQSAPKVVLDVFSGEVLEYAYFKAAFREVVESTIQDQKGRLTRLIQFTSGEAKSLIKHLHSNDNGYSKAIEILDAEYGDIHTVTNSYLKELRLWPAIRLNDVQAFKNFHQFLLKCLAYKEGAKLLELDSTEVIRSIIIKLHTSYHERWNHVANKIMLKKQRAATFQDLVQFMADEKKLLCNPMYSK